MGVKHFKTMVSYKKWLAAGHIHNFFKVPGHQTVYIGGKLHKVKHGK